MSALVKVSERMPTLGVSAEFKGKPTSLPISDDVLLYWSETETYGIGYYDDEKKEWGVWDAFCVAVTWCDYPPSHWMPLPEVA